jgi:hypothetical protein
MDGVVRRHISLIRLSAILGPKYFSTWCRGNTLAGACEEFMRKQLPSHHREGPQLAEVNETHYCSLILVGVVHLHFGYLHYTPTSHGSLRSRNMLVTLGQQQ